jgi:hypothetical protein
MQEPSSTEKAKVIEMKAMTLTKTKGAPTEQMIADPLPKSFPKQRFLKVGDKLVLQELGPDSNNPH